MSDRTYTVYKGEKGGRIVYIGTTIQKPEDRFRWHKANGKPLKFTVVGQYQTSDEMLNEEYRLIKLHEPSMNKIKHRPQNLNAELSQDALDARKGSPEWCQCCLRRRTNVGYRKCYWCTKNKINPTLAVSKDGTRYALTEVAISTESPDWDLPPIDLDTRDLGGAEHRKAILKGGQP